MTKHQPHLTPFQVKTAWLQIHQDGPRHLESSSGFIEVDVDALQLQVTIPMASTCRVDAVLVGNDFPELGTDLA